MSKYENLVKLIQLTARDINQDQDFYCKALQGLGDISSTLEALLEAMGSEPQLDSLDFVPVCDITTGVVIGYASVIYDEVADSTVTKWFDTTLTEVDAQPDNSALCPNGEQIAKIEGLDLIPLCDNESDNLSGYVSVTYKLDEDIVESIFFDTGFNQVESAPDNSSICTFSTDIAEAIGEVLEDILPIVECGESVDLDTLLNFKEGADPAVLQKMAVDSIGGTSYIADDINDGTFPQIYDSSNYDGESTDLKSVATGWVYNYPSCVTGGEVEIAFSYTPTSDNDLGDPVDGIILLSDGQGNVIEPTTTNASVLLGGIGFVTEPYNIQQVILGTYIIPDGSEDLIISLFLQDNNSGTDDTIITIDDLVLTQISVDTSNCENSGEALNTKICNVGEITGPINGSLDDIKSTIEEGNTTLTEIKTSVDEVKTEIESTNEKLDAVTGEDCNGDDVLKTEDVCLGEKVDLTNIKLDALILATGANVDGDDTDDDIVPASVHCFEGDNGQFTGSLILNEDGTFKEFYIISGTAPTDPTTVILCPEKEYTCEDPMIIKQVERTWEKDLIDIKIIPKNIVVLSSAELAVYDLKTNTKEVIPYPPLRPSSDGFNIAADENGNLYSVQGQFNPKFQYYDRATQTWSYIPITGDLPVLASGGHIDDNKYYYTRLQVNGGSPVIYGYIDLDTNVATSQNYTFEGLVGNIYLISDVVRIKGRTLIHVYDTQFDRSNPSIWTSHVYELNEDTNTFEKILDVNGEQIGYAGGNKIIFLNDTDGIIAYDLDTHTPTSLSYLGFTPTIGSGDISSFGDETYECVNFIRKYKIDCDGNETYEDFDYYGNPYTVLGDVSIQCPTLTKKYESSDFVWNDGCSDIGVVKYRQYKNDENLTITEYVYLGHLKGTSIEPTGFSPFPCSEVIVTSYTLTTWCTDNGSVYRKDYDDGTFIWFNETGTIPQPTSFNIGECPSQNSDVEILEQTICSNDVNYIRREIFTYTTNQDGDLEISNIQILWFNEDGIFFDSGVVVPTTTITETDYSIGLCDVGTLLPEPVYVPHVVGCIKRTIPNTIDISSVPTTASSPFTLDGVTLTYTGNGDFGTLTVGGTNYLRLKTPTGTANSELDHVLDDPSQDLSVNIYDLDANEILQVEVYQGTTLVPWDNTWITHQGSEIDHNGGGEFQGNTSTAQPVINTDRTLTLHLPDETTSFKFIAHDTVTDSGRNILYDIVGVATEESIIQVKQILKDVGGVITEEYRVLGDITTVVTFDPNTDIFSTDCYGTQPDEDDNPKLISTLQGCIDDPDNVGETIDVYWLVYSNGTVTGPFEKSTLPQTIQTNGLTDGNGN